MNTHLERKQHPQAQQSPHLLAVVKELAYHLVNLGHLLKRSLRNRVRNRVRNSKHGPSSERTGWDGLQSMTENEQRRNRPRPP